MGKSENEIWKNISCCQNYMASNLGRVKRISTNRILKQSLDTSNRFIVRLTHDGKQKTWRVHQLVAISFLNHVPCGHKIVVDHIDNNKSNNRLDNLQLITQRENSTKDKKTKSGITGVYKHRKKYRSMIYINGINEKLGSYDTPEQASQAYQNRLKQCQE